MSNTVIQLKYSNVTGAPPTLNLAEPAYSTVSNKLWIGDGSTVVAIGGKHYTDQIDAATSEATGNTFVIRDLSGNASFNYITANVINATIDGNANSATQLQTPRTIALEGDANGSVIFSGTADANITVDLTATGVSAGHYGSTSQIPTFEVDTDGRILSTSNVDVTFAISGDSGTDTINLRTDTLGFVGGIGITSSVDSVNNFVTFDVDDTVIRANTSSIGEQVILSDLVITGNVTITGNTKTIDTQTLNISDPLIYLAANNYSSDVVDIGFAGNYFDGVNQQHTGLIRHAADGKMYAFTGYTPEPDSVIDPSHESFVKAILVTDIESGNVSNLFTAIDVTDGGTGFRTANTGDLIYGTGTNTLGKLLKPSTNSYLRMGDSGLPEWVDTIDVADGGTGNTAFTLNHVILGNGTSPLTTVGSSVEGHILTIDASGAPTFQHLSGGTF